MHHNCGRQFFTKLFGVIWWAVFFQRRGTLLKRFRNCTSAMKSFYLNSVEPIYVDNKDSSKLKMSVVKNKTFSRPDWLSYVIGKFHIFLLILSLSAEIVIYQNKISYSPSWCSTKTTRKLCRCRSSLFQWMRCLPSYSQWLLAIFCYHRLIIAYSSEVLENPSIR